MADVKKKLLRLPEDLSEKIQDEANRNKTSWNEMAVTLLYRATAEDTE